MKRDKEVIVIKYGGNAMLNEDLTGRILEQIIKLHNEDYYFVIVHGGGPFIQSTLDMASIDSEFIGGQRKTSIEAMKFIEMVLKGEVNSSLVGTINKLGAKAVGLSGKDGKLAVASKRYHYDESSNQVDLGQVGNIAYFNTEIINLLLNNDYIPVVATIASGEDGSDYNINADIFAGHLAGALHAEKFIMLTDVDGLMKNPDDEGSLIKELSAGEIESLIGTVIKGGMIPKTEACKKALELGAKRALIANGTKPETLYELITNNNTDVKSTLIYH